MKKNNIPVNRVIVLDIDGNEISTMFANRALKYIANNKAEIVAENPLTIRLLYVIEEVDHDSKD